MCCIVLLHLIRRVRFLAFLLVVAALLCSLVAPDTLVINNPVQLTSKNVVADNNRNDALMDWIAVLNATTNTTLANVLSASIDDSIASIPGDAALFAVLELLATHSVRIVIGLHVGCIRFPDEPADMGFYCVDVGQTLKTLHKISWNVARQVAVSCIVGAILTMIIAVLQPRYQSVMLIVSGLFLVGITPGWWALIAQLRTIVPHATVRRAQELGFDVRINPHVAWQVYLLLGTGIFAATIGIVHIIHERKHKTRTRQDTNTLLADETSV